MQTSLSGLCGRVEVSPPEVGGEQLVVLTHLLHVGRGLCDKVSNTGVTQGEGYTCNVVVEIFKVDVGVWGGDVGHVGTIQHDGDDVVLQHLPELLRHVVSAQRVL